jgi:hypothetical protein
MTHTREALDRLKAGITLVPRAFVLPARSASQRMVEALNAAELRGREAPVVAMEALRKRLREAFAQGRAADVGRRDLRDAPWILWNGSPPAAGFPGLLDAVFGVARESPRVTRAMIEAWLRDFVPGDNAIAAAGNAIQRLLNLQRDGSLTPWFAAQSSFALFDAMQGPRRVADALLSGPGSVAEVWARACLDDPFRASGGYAQAVLRELAVGLPAKLRVATGKLILDRSFEALAPEGVPRFGRELRGDVGRGLLGAWLEGRTEPSPALREPVRDFLLRHLGDPRLRAADWTPVGEAGTSLMRQWLARASLKAFFEVISEHALDHQWRYREAFWSACLERGAIQDAWLALGYRVYSTARTLRELAGAYGKLEGGGVASDHSVLLMRVGPLVLCEWSHNGKLRAWPSDWSNAPKLYQHSYSRGDLVGKGLPFPPNPETGSRGSSDGHGLSHMGSENGTWQGSAAELLARRAGIRLTPSDWRPR